MIVGRLYLSFGGCIGKWGYNEPWSVDYGSLALSSKVYDLLRFMGAIGMYVYNSAHYTKYTALLQPIPPVQSLQRWVIKQSFQNMRVDYWKSWY
jgi:hypothetical protein